MGGEAGSGVTGGVGPSRRIGLRRVLTCFLALRGFLAGWGCTGNGGPFGLGLRPCGFVDPLPSLGLGDPSLRHADFLANAICRVKEESRRATVMDTRDQRGDLPQISRHPGLGIVLSGCFTPFLRLEKAQELAGLTLLFRRTMVGL